LSKYPFIQAKNYTKGPRRGKVDLIVIHTMEAPEKPETAENVAKWFAGSTAPKASPHYCIDSNSIVQCVKESDIAWCAPGANSNGVHFEHAGYAKQGAAEWKDAYSKAMLDRSAKLAAEVCARHGIPVVWLTAADLLAGKRGITAHAEVSQAFKKSDHWDPGKNFPIKDYIARIKFYSK
jgi:N-acetyl-anhydromuramyl-L-alanine amidase AmpD